MKIELIGADGEVITLMGGVINPNQEFEQYYREAYGAVSWREYQEPAKTADEILAEKLAAIRVQRNQLLAECDYTQLADAPLTVDQRTDWAAYRQALRDLPNQPGFDPDNISWPVPPT
jgi:hypothetical protein